MSDQQDDKPKVPLERWSIEDASDYDYLDRPPTYYEGEDPPAQPPPIETPESDTRSD